VLLKLVLKDLSDVTDLYTAACATPDLNILWSVYLIL